MHIDKAYKIEKKIYMMRLITGYSRRWCASV